MRYCGNLFNQAYIILKYFLTGQLRLTPAKALNLMLSFCEQRLKVSKCASMPVFLVLETASVCNLKCPFCPCGDDSRRLERKFMALAEYKKIIDKTYRHAIHAALFLYGEPLLNKDIVAMVEYTSSKGILSTIHTNMNVMTERLAEGLIRAGLFRLVVSADGCTQPSYEKYRVGGNIDAVFRNVETFVEVKRRLKKKTPIIAWAYLVNKYNQHEIKQARSRAKSLGVDAFSLEPFDIPDQKQERMKWAPSIDRYSSYDQQTFKEKQWPVKFCRLWDTFIVDCEGDNYFCCFASLRKSNSYGNVFLSDIKDLWNSREMALARKLVRGKSSNGNNICCASCRFLPKNFTQTINNSLDKIKY